MSSAGFMGAFARVGIASKVKQKKMTAERSPAQWSGGAQPDQHLEQVYVGSRE